MLKPTYKTLAYEPMTLGGLAIELLTEKGAFFVYSISKNLHNIEFHYAQDGDLTHSVKSSEIDATFGDGTYENLKEHVMATVARFEIEKWAERLHQQWLRQLDNPAFESDIHLASEPQQLLVVSTNESTPRIYAIPKRDPNTLLLSDCNGCAYDELPAIIRKRIEDGTYPQLDNTHTIEI